MMKRRKSVSVTIDIPLIEKMKQNMTEKENFSDVTNRLIEKGLKGTTVVVDTAILEKMLPTFIELKIKIDLTTQEIARITELAK